MPRQRDPKRDEAFKIWKASKGQKLLKDIATKLDVSDSQIRKWKSQDKWDERIKGNVTNKNAAKGNVTKQDAVSRKKSGKRGGNPHPVAGFSKHNRAALKHGFFAKIFPNDEETKEIIDEIVEKSPLDMLWENIVIQYTAIARAQKIMWVQDQEDMSKEIKKQKTAYDINGDEITETEFEIQFAWDKQATFLNAQARAMSNLQSLIKNYEEMLRAEGKDEKQDLELQKLRLEVKDLSGDLEGDAHEQNQNYLDAIGGQTVADVFANDDESEADE